MEVGGVGGRFGAGRKGRRQSTAAGMRKECGVDGAGRAIEEVDRECGRRQCCVMGSTRGAATNRFACAMA